METRTERKKARHEERQYGINQCVNIKRGQEAKNGATQERTNYRNKGKRNKDIRADEWERRRKEEIAKERKGRGEEGNMASQREILKEDRKERREQKKRQKNDERL